MSYNKLIQFFLETEKLKTTYRYSTRPGKMQDSSADHSWKLSFMAMCLGETENLGIDLYHVIKMCLVHDLAEYITGEFDSTLTVNNPKLKEHKKNLETQAMLDFAKKIPEFGNEIYNLWNEFEERKTPSSKCAVALDKLEGMLHVLYVGVELDGAHEHTYHYADSAVKEFPPLASFLNEVKLKLKSAYELNGICVPD